MQVIPLTADKAAVQAAINGLKVFEPPDCSTNPAAGSCLDYDVNTGVFTGASCLVYELHSNEPEPDPSSCNSSNVGGALLWAANTLSDTTITRPESFWVVVALLSGPANVTDSTPTYPYGFVPCTRGFQCLMITIPGAGTANRV